MQIVYAFIYYFAILMLLMTASLLVFLLAPARRLLHRFRTTFAHIFQNEIVKYTVYFCFAIILLILFESIYTFSTLNTHFKRKLKFNPDSMGMKDFDVMSSTSQQNYLMQLKEYREYYMAERNILLSFAALFIFFAFQRILHNIVTYAETEHRISAINGTHSQQAKKNQ